LRFRFLSLIVSVLLLSACATGTQIQDFSDRSVGYGWLDIEDVDANRLHSVEIYQFRPQVSEPYYPARVIPFKKGYLYFSAALPAGAHKTVSASGQSCVGFICSNTLYRYSFGKQGDAVGAVVISTPGVYSLGSYKLKPVKTGFLEQDKFDVEPAKNAPSKREMLEEILKSVQDKPVLVERVQRELASVK
jgi:hypothetical protein